MADVSERQTAQSQVRAETVANNAPEFVATGLNAAGMDYALQITFNTTVFTAGEQQHAIVKNVGTVLMPWNLAKSLHQIIGSLLENYEATNGVVHLPKAFVERAKGGT
jgi:hypothetical protein